mmetsp:Transcript_33288/g.59597  ORF Transcript_33288/g.59597 Transcript_33288/m.59597 type:complete len:202 (+) Transcript_33288:971-1576(+)
MERMRCSAASTPARKTGVTVSTAATCSSSSGALRQSATGGSRRGSRPTMARCTSCSAQQSEMLRACAALHDPPSCRSSEPAAAMYDARSASNTSASPTLWLMCTLSVSLLPALFSSSCRRPTSFCTSAALGMARVAPPGNVAITASPSLREEAARYMSRKGPVASSRLSLSICPAAAAVPLMSVSRTSFTTVVSRSNAKRG